MPWHNSGLQAARTDISMQVSNILFLISVSIDLMCVWFMHISSNDKDNANERKESLLSVSRVPLILYKDNESECNESLLLYCRAHLILYKDNANERKESLLSISRVHVIFDKDTNKIITQASMSTNFYPYAVRWRFNMMLWAGDGCVSCLITPLYAMAERMKKRRCCEPLCDIKSYLCIRKSGAYAVWLRCFYYR